jgi:putative phosphonate metabolism protein
MHRYAIYWAPPPRSPLAEIGEAWLGRSAGRDGAIARPMLPGFAAAELDAATAEPRRYGLHATLKPPFRLAAGKSAASLERALDAFAARTTEVAAPGLTLKRIGRFLALVPSARAPALAALAAAAVAAFDEFRAPADAAELARRQEAGLSEAQRRNLARWGYPYVMEEFRFHVTLTGAIATELAERLAPLLAERFAPAMAEPLHVGELSLFAEPAPGAPFRLLRRTRLASPPSGGSPYIDTQ